VEDAAEGAAKRAKSERRRGRGRAAAREPGCSGRDRGQRDPGVIEREQGVAAAAACGAGSRADARGCLGGGGERGRCGWERGVECIAADAAQGGGQAVVGAAATAATIGGQRGGCIEGCRPPWMPDGGRAFAQRAVQCFLRSLITICSCVQFRLRAFKPSPSHLPHPRFNFAPCLCRHPHSAD